MGHSRARLTIAFGILMALTGTVASPATGALSSRVGPPSALAADTPACQVTYTVTDQWPTGFNADVTIRNNGPALNGWTLAWSFPGSQRISDAWNATATQTGAAVQATNAGWNASLPGGGTANFGFNASYGGANPALTAFSLNG